VFADGEIFAALSGCRCRLGPRTSAAVHGRAPAVVRRGLRKHHGRTWPALPPGTQPPVDLVITRPPGRGACSLESTADLQHWRDIVSGHKEGRDSLGQAHKDQTVAVVGSDTIVAIGLTGRASAGCGGQLGPC